MAGPFFPPPKCSDLSIYFLDFWIMLFFMLYLNSIDLYQAENQVFKPTSSFVIVGWERTWPAHFSPLLNLSIFLFIV